jgi:hypothetical protein
VLSTNWAQPAAANNKRSTPVSLALVFWEELWGREEVFGRKGYSYRGVRRISLVRFCLRPPAGGFA